MNAQSLVCERGETVKRFVGFCGGPVIGRGRVPCTWTTDPMPSGEQAERAVLDHYQTAHPMEYAAVSSGALNGRLVGAPVSRVDLEDDD